MNLFKTNIFKEKPKKCSDREALINALSDLESELNALENVANIVVKTELDEPMSIYLCERVADHTENIRKSFRLAWNAA